jgi:hypothetical protein
MVILFDFLCQRLYLHVTISRHFLQTKVDVITDTSSYTVKPVKHILIVTAKLKIHRLQTIRRMYKFPDSSARWLHPNDME